MSIESKPVIFYRNFLNGKKGQSIRIKILWPQERN